MSTAIARVSQDAATLRSSIAEALAFVCGIDSTDAAREAVDRVKLAKEWAKIRKVAKEVHADLLRLEIHLMRKIAQLDAVAVLPTAHRAAATFFRNKTDAEIETLIESYGDDGSPVRVMKRALGEDDFSRARSATLRGDYARSERYVGDEARAESVRSQSTDLKERLAGLLEHYYEGDEGFSVFEFAEQVCQSTGLDERNATWGAHQGLLEVCRKAVRDAPSIAIAGTDAPRFVTCIDRSSAFDIDAANSGDPHWIRVPFHSASLDQLADMVELRREQARKAVVVAEALEKLHDSLASRVLPHERSSSLAGIEPDVTLGELAARVAFEEQHANTG